MEIRKMPAGKTAPADTDCILIEEGADGKFRLNASALDKEESIAIVGGGPYESYDKAEAAGLAWANEHGVQTLFVETARA